MERNEILKKVNDVFIDVLEEEVSIKEEYSSYDVDGWDSDGSAAALVDCLDDFF